LVGDVDPRPEARIPPLVEVILTKILDAICMQESYRVAGSQGVLTVRMLPTSLLNEFHMKSDRGILDTRCHVPQGPTI
jgi:hypothetical protein